MSPIVLATLVQAVELMLVALMLAMLADRFRSTLIGGTPHA